MSYSITHRSCSDYCYYFHLLCFLILKFSRLTFKFQVVFYFLKSRLFTQLVMLLVACSKVTVGVEFVFIASAKVSSSSRMALFCSTSGLEK
jgi:hypothetical protein